MITMVVALGAALLMGSSCTYIQPVTATSNPIGSKVGTARAFNVGGLWTEGDYSIRTAAKNGKITKISTVDIQKSQYCGFIYIFETIVTGE